MKYEWRKQEKNLYGAKPVPALVQVPTQTYLMINGKGNPNEEEFSNKVSALYSLAYGIKMAYKASAAQTQDEHAVTDYTVYPLEGIWTQEEWDGTLVKDRLVYTIMIRQPDFITETLFQAALEKVKKKKPSPFYDKIRFDSMEDGTCIQILHQGSYDQEPASFQKMEEFALQNGLMRTGSCHREIYLSNASRVEESRQKTILRFQAAPVMSD